MRSGEIEYFRVVSVVQHKVSEQLHPSCPFSEWLMSRNKRYLWCIVIDWLYGDSDVRWSTPHIAIMNLKHDSKSGGINAVEGCSLINYSTH